MAEAKKELENINKGIVAESADLLSVEDIANSNDVEYKIITAWDGKKVRIQSLTAGDLIEWSEANEGEAKRTAGLRLIVKSMVDGAGQQLMNDKHLGMLRRKSHRITEDIVKAILQLNGIRTKQQMEEAKKD